MQAVLANSFGAIYERNAINAAFPVLTYESIEALGLEDRDRIKVDFETGTLTNIENGKSIRITPFYDVQMEIYQRGGLL